MKKPRHHGPRILRRLADGVESKPFDLFELTPVGVTLGAQINGVDMREPLRPEVHAEVHRALLEWKVLFFRDQQITPEQHVAFAKNWGALEIHPALKEGSLPELVRFEKGAGAAEAPVTPANAGYENTWHSDVTWREIPSLGSILRCVDGPAVGGDTLWADMCAAYDQLDAATLDAVATKTASNSFMAAFGSHFPESERAAMAAKFPDASHPMIRTHPETGRKLVYVNAIFTQAVNGVELDASEDLLDTLFATANIPELQVRWNWRPNDVAFWDNRATQHYACSDYWPQRRVMERATIVGDRPY
jgi:taurine dioxygenase